MEEIKVRVQLPRSLWDPSFNEENQVAKNYYGATRPLRLIPWLKEKIAAH